MVGYRAFTLRHASELDLSGTIANRADGSVECVVEGPRPAVEALLERLRRGPYHAEVEALDVVFEAPSGNLPPMRVTA
jgi:acylphosphatase